MNKIKTFWRKFRTSFAERKLVFALSLAICATICLTILGVTIYNVGGFYRYDLSRPGFEKERAEISTTPTDVPYDTTSPLSKQAADDFLKEFDQHRKNVQDYDSFGDGSLSDDSLGLSSQTNAQQ